jgi:hypothetical protein
VRRGSHCSTFEQFAFESTCLLSVSGDFAQHFLTEEATFQKYVSITVPAIHGL